MYHIEDNVSQYVQETLKRILSSVTSSTYSLLRNQKKITIYASLYS